MSKLGHFAQIYDFLEKLKKELLEYGQVIYDF